jgi:hypothetical protein
MHSRLLRTASLIPLLLVIASCSKQDQGSLQKPEAEEPGSPPNIALSVARGVAFNYAYQFSLPDQRIAAAQEAHAGACEKLGLDRCRITGMSYHVDDSEQVTAELDLKLDPAIARQFGKSAEQVVRGSDGKLVRLDIGSSDEGAVIDQASRQRQDDSARVGQLKAELEKTEPGSKARADVLGQLQAAEQQQAGQQRTIEASQAALAVTPMTFHYYGHGAVPGFRTNPLHDAWVTFLTTVVGLVRILLQALAILLPFVLLLTAIVALWRSRLLRPVRGWFKAPPPTDE